MPMRKYRPTSSTSASCSSSCSSSNSTITNLTVTNVTPTITTLAGATSLTPVVPQHYHQLAIATATSSAQRVVHHHHHHAANCNLNLITTAAAAAGAYQTVTPQPQPAALQRTTIHPAPPILDPLPLCLDANGTYLCTAYNPRCYIIQKLTPTPVSCITYELTPVAPFTAIPATSVASPAGSAACIEEIIEYPKPHPATVEFIHHQQQQQQHHHHLQPPHVLQYVDAAGIHSANLITPTSGTSSSGGIVNPNSVSNSSATSGHNELLSVIEAIGAGGSSGEVIPMVASSATNFAFINNSIASSSSAGGPGQLTAGGIASGQPADVGGVTKVQTMLQPTALTIGSPVGSGYAATPVKPASIAAGESV